MYLTLLALPMLGSIVAGLLGRKIGVTGAHMITCITISLTAVISLIAFYEVGLCHSPVSIRLGSWIDSESLNVDWGFLFDGLTVSMLLAVVLVSFLVHLFSVNYMAGDPHNQRFFSYLSMFTFFMLILVTGDNYLVMFLGWEGIGISSYLLINFWYTRLQANKSAIKALTVNRVGDTFLTVGFFAALWVFGTVDYATIFSLSPYMHSSGLTLIGLLFLLAAMGKSAQLGLHTWLPDAMEGPTPVSALIHAATLVTAGVYLLLRSSPLLEYAPTALLAITWVGAITAFFAATTGLLQNDLKRVIAFSTCSQIGYLFMAVGLSQYDVAIFHLVNHAFFKALLFLAAGGVLHSIADMQDLRRLGGLAGFLPFTYTCLIIGSLSLMALPWLSGFYSKDKILEFAFGQYEASGHIVYWLGSITAGLTAFYSYRLLSLTFFTEPMAPRGDYEHTHEQALIVCIPYVILALLSIFFGYIASDLFTGPGSTILSNALFVHPNHVVIIEGEFALPLMIKNLPLILSLFGAGFALLLYHLFPNVLMYISQTPVGAIMYRFFNAKWGLDIVYNRYIIEPALRVGGITSQILDLGVIELLGPFGISQSLYGSSARLVKLDTGSISEYGLYIFVAAISATLLLVTPSFGAAIGTTATEGNSFTFLLPSDTDIRIVLLYGAALFYHTTSSQEGGGETIKSA